MLQKTGYIAQLFFILVLAFSKLSTVAFVIIISPKRLDHQASIVVGAFVSLWSVASLLTVAFQCGLPNTWVIFSDHCIKQVSAARRAVCRLGAMLMNRRQATFWTAYSIVNVLTEYALVVLPCAVVLNSHIKRETKFVTVGVFHLRLA